MGDAKGHHHNAADAPNPILSRIPLDAKQSYRLKSSWKAVHRKLEDAGVMIFIKYVNYAYLRFQLTETTLQQYKLIGSVNFSPSPSRRFRCLLANPPYLWLNGVEPTM